MSIRSGSGEMVEAAPVPALLGAGAPLDTVLLAEGLRELGVGLLEGVSSGSEVLAHAI